MKKILIYCETLLYLKGIDQLLKDSITDIQTTLIHSVESLKEQVLHPQYDLLIIHLDFTMDSPEYLLKHITETPFHIPLLMLTDNIEMAQKLCADLIDNTHFLDIRNTIPKISGTVTSILGNDNLHNLSND